MAEGVLYVDKHRSEKARLRAKSVFYRLDDYMGMCFDCKMGKVKAPWEFTESISVWAIVLDIELFYSLTASRARYIYKIWGALKSFNAAHPLFIEHIGDGWDFPISRFKEFFMVSWKHR